MAAHVIYLKLEGYVRMWLIRNFTNDGLTEPVIFPKWSKENDIIQDNLQRKPEFWKPVKEEGTIAIKVPKQEGLNRDSWCYVSTRKLVFLRREILKHFLDDFMAFIAKANSATPTYKKRILDFMAKNGIEDNKNNLETLLQIRVRNRHLYPAPEDIDSKANKSHKGCHYEKKKRRK